MNEEVLNACRVLKNFCKAKGETREGCNICPFEDSCCNNWTRFDNLEECMDGLIADIKASEITADYKGAYEEFYKTICAKFDGNCKGCMYKSKTDLCPFEVMEKVI